MRKLTMILSLIIISSINFITYSQDDFANWAELKPNLPVDAKNSFDNMKLNTPARSEIDIPPYPDAVIISTSQSTQSVDLSKDPELPTVTLLSNDMVGKVVAVYKDVLLDFPDWHWDENLKLFYKGDLQDALNRRSPSVVVSSITADEPDLMYISSDELKNASSKIVICYNPEK